MSVTDYSKPPPRAWWFPPNQWRAWWPSKGSDEWGRHTFVVPLLVFGAVVVAYKPCDCEDMRDFACTTPGCPYLGITGESACLYCEPLDDEGDER